MMDDNLEKELLQFIPLDKSWIIRMAALDLTLEYSDIKSFLEKQENLGEDLSALKQVVENWNSQEINVGESGTLYRFVRFHDWKNKINRSITKTDTLKLRSMCDNPEIVNWPPEELLKLDNNTSQWATMAYLLGDRRKVSNPPFKLQVTYDGVEHWESARKKKECWKPRYDKTIEKQARAFVNLMRTGIINFEPEQSEDYCFARAFGSIGKEEGIQRFPSLAGHESNRLVEMEDSLKEAETEARIYSKDHRVVQAVAMRMTYKRRGVAFETSDSANCVNKTWPKFWDFMNYCGNSK